MSLILLQGIRSIATITQMSVSLKFLGLFLPAEYRVDFTTVTSKYTGCRVDNLKIVKFIPV